jgi:hypothetical protein
MKNVPDEFVNLAKGIYRWNAESVLWMLLTGVIKKCKRGMS